MGQTLMMLRDMGYQNQTFMGFLVEKSVNEQTLSVAKKMGFEVDLYKAEFHAIHEIEHAVINLGFNLVGRNPTGISQLEGCYDEIFSWSLREKNPVGKPHMRKTVANVFSIRHGFRFLDISPEEKIQTLGEALVRMNRSPMSNRVKTRIHYQVMKTLNHKFADRLEETFTFGNQEEIVSTVIDRAYRLMNHVQNYMTEEGENLWRRALLQLKLFDFKKARFESRNCAPLDKNNSCYTHSCKTI